MKASSGCAAIASSIRTIGRFIVPASSVGAVLAETVQLPPAYTKAIGWQESAFGTRILLRGKFPLQTCSFLFLHHKPLSRIEPRKFFQRHASHHQKPMFLLHDITLSEASYLLEPQRKQLYLRQLHVRIFADEISLGSAVLLGIWQAQAKQPGAHSRTAAGCYRNTGPSFAAQPHHTLIFS